MMTREQFHIALLCARECEGATAAGAARVDLREHDNAQRDLIEALTISCRVLEQEIATLRTQLEERC